MKRLVVLDTETTGLSPDEGHRIIEVGAIEILDRKVTSNCFHEYINPQRLVDEEAFNVHGISNEMLRDKPFFEEITDKFLAYLKGADSLIIHNAPFDIGFLHAELQRIHNKFIDLTEAYNICDSLLLAKKMHPGQKNNLNALCKRYDIDNSNRQLHGALLDSELLAEVYLKMTGGQQTLFGGSSRGSDDAQAENATFVLNRPEKLLVLKASEEEKKEHKEYMQEFAQKENASMLWEKYFQDYALTSGETEEVQL